MHHIRPIPGDPSAKMIESDFDLASDDWWLASLGTYRCAPLEIRNFGTASWEQVVAIEWPGHSSRDNEEKILRILMLPGGAFCLGSQLLQVSEKFLLA